MNDEGVGVLFADILYQDITLSYKISLQIKSYIRL